jgi:TRAP-type C4-dicarboxylate transport system permease small subunit
LASRPSGDTFHAFAQEVVQFLQPARLILVSINMSNFGALIFPFVLMYLNSKLPKAARPKGWVYVVLVQNFPFFGFFFLNFVVNELTGEALVTF